MQFVTVVFEYYDEFRRMIYTFNRENYRYQRCKTYSPLFIYELYKEIDFLFRREWKSFLWKIEQKLKNILFGL